MAKRTSRAEAGARMGARFTTEQQQEYISRAQVTEKLVEQRWVPNPVMRDHGEDELVQIFDENGRSTGLLFLIQAKSTTDLPGLHVAAKKAIAYRLFVADVVHWEKSVVPVVLFVWDVGRRDGRWELLSKIIERLDKDNSAWRTRKTTTAHVPVTNTIDKTGLQSLRKAVADRFLPLVKKEGHFNVMVSFPSTASGRAEAKKFANALDTGRSVTVDGKYVSGIDAPEWWTRLYGTFPEIASFSVQGRPPTKPIATRLEISGPNGSAALAQLELKATRFGRKEIELTNKHQNPVIEVGFTIERLGEGASVRMHFRQARAGRTVLEQREALLFQRASLAGGTIRMLETVTGKAIIEHPLPKLSANRTPEEIQWHLDLIEKLCALQQYVAPYGSFVLPRRWTGDIVSLIDRMYRALQGERIPTTINFGAVIDGRGATKIPEGTTGPVELGLTSTMNLLGVDVPLGVVRVHVLDTERFINAHRRAVDRSLALGRDVRVRLRNLSVIEEYSEWGINQTPSRRSQRLRVMSNCGDDLASSGGRARRS